MKSFRLDTLARLVPLLVFLAIYTPTSGHGFISDDFRWIAEARVRSASDVTRIAQSDNGFYRPIVAFSFAVNELIFGLDPKPYGLTNVFLALACGIGVAALARSLGARNGESWLAGLLWLLNFHGINMGILWISGRTAFLLVLFATTCAVLLHRGRELLAIVALAAALFAKEEAVILPALLFIGLLIRNRAGDRIAVRPAVWLVSSGATLVAYLLVRLTTNAMTPQTAPHYYRFTFEPWVLLRNLAEYADRALTWPVILAVLAVIILCPSEGWHRGRLRLAVSYGILWVVGGYALTVFLPVRSSLYACLPSVGGCIAAAAVCASAWDRSSERRRRIVLVVAILLAPCLSPVYYARTSRWVSLADFSSQALIDIGQHTAGLPDGAVVELIDDPTRRVNVSSAFGSMLTDAVQLIHGKRLHFWIDLDAHQEDRPCASCIDLRLATENGRIVPR